MMHPFLIDKQGAVQETSPTKIRRDTFLSNAPIHATTSSQAPVLECSGFYAAKNRN
jgi:hypothetical protein